MNNSKSENQNHKNVDNGKIWFQNFGDYFGLGNKLMGERIPEMRTTGERKSLLGQFSYGNKIISSSSSIYLTCV